MNDPTKISVAVLIVSGNQRDKSVSAVKQIWAMKPASWNTRIYFVDLGSTDGTAEAIESLGLDLKLVQGSASWRGGRALHEAQISIDQAFDYLLLVHDDITVFQDTYMRLDEFRKQYPTSILVGQLSDPATGELNFGGYEVDSGSELKFTHKLSQRLPVDVETFDGHLVIIPKKAADAVGYFDTKYSRAFSERDFGLRATQKRIRVLALPGFFGSASTMPKTELKSRRDSLRHLHNLTAQPPMPTLRFLIRHSRVRWAVQFVVPYLRILFKKSQ